MYASNSGGSAISGATSKAFAMPTGTEGTYYYYVIVTNTINDVDGIKTATVRSNVATVIVAQLVLEINVSSVSGRVGDEVTQVATLEKNPGIASYTLTYKFPEELVFIRALPGDILTGAFYANTDVAGQVTLYATSQFGTDVNTGSIMFEILFKINENPLDGKINESNGLNLGFHRPGDSIESGGRRIASTFHQGEINIISLLYGDVNMDGVIDLLDVTLLLRCVWGRVEPSDNLCTINADVNGDGVIDLMDVTRLLRYVWGIDTSPLGPITDSGGFYEVTT